MKINKYPAPPTESAASRYDRDWLHIPDLDTAGNDDDRHDRTLLQQAVERKSRRYVDDGVSAVTGGSPVFDPNDGAENPGGTTALWSESFTSELDPSWTLHGTYNPPGGKPNGGEDVLFQISRAFPYNEFRLEFDVDYPITPGTEEDYFVLMIGVQSADETGGGVMVSFNPETHEVIAGLQGGGVSEEINITGSHFVFIKRADGLSIIADGVETSFAGQVTLGEGSTLQVVLQTSIGGSIKNITAYDLSTNGGGTPEPEIPSEPEVPEGSYTEEYREVY